MNWYGIIGIITISIPFLFLFMMIARRSGWKVALNIYLLTFFVVSWIFFSAYLLEKAGWLK